MLRINRILLRGPGIADATIGFEQGSNILAGASDTGKSLLLHCLDYIFGADEMRKRIPETEPYAQLFVEFVNDRQETLTLERSLSGGNLAVRDVPIDDIAAAGRTVSPRRYGTSLADDVTSVLLPFASIPEARLRKNNLGDTQRLTIRSFFPLILVDEISVIAEQSPILGESGFDDTARKRMFSFMLTGKDDTGVIAAEKREIVKARLTARLGMIEDLLTPLEKRLDGKSTNDGEDSVEKLDASIAQIHAELAETEDQRASIQAERQQASETLERAQT